jgi:uncharacterized protein (DUF58 family)
MVSGDPTSGASRDGGADAAPERLAAGYTARSPRARALFDAAFLSRLEYLRIVSRRAFAGAAAAARRGLRTGAGLEFSEHRPYTPGDDYRYLDWAAYGRLDRLLLRLFQQDEDLRIALLVDVSGSMLTGRPAKVDAARRLAAALAYVGLSNLDRIRLSVFAAGEAARLSTRRGRGQIFPVLDFLADAPTGGPTDLARAVREFQQHVRERGLVIVLSDFLDPAGFEEPLGRLAHGGNELWAMAVESPEEADPPWRGDVRLTDAETGGELALALTPERVAAYQARRGAFAERLRRWCLERGVQHLRMRTDVPADELVLDVLRRGGLLK